MKTDVEDAVKTNSDILTKWLHSDDFFKKAFAGIIIANGGKEAQ